MTAFQTVIPLVRPPVKHVTALCHHWDRIDLKRISRRVCTRKFVLASAIAASASTSSAAEREDVSVTPRAEDYSAWYQSVISSADLAEPSPVRGCLVIKPHGYAIWELLQRELDKRIKQTGAQNAYFPLFIPQSFLSQEAEHVEGFAKECAVVTHHRLRAVPDGPPGTLEADPAARLDEPLVVRPTSETIIWHMFARWVSSYRDLPLQINQWANVIRWEMRTRPFLRTTEFIWQEGHTAHASAEEAHEKAKEIIALYRDVVRDMLAMPVVLGVKSPSERFAGAAETYTIEALMQNGWALQAGTSHYLGDSFPRAFNVTYTDDNGVSQHPWGTSWGVTTRLVGALIMTHSDDTGLVLPPAIAPTQIVLVLIFKTDEQRRTVCEFAKNVAERLRAVGLRVAVDDRAGMRPGAKYFKWERKGVPLRMEIGPKDTAKNAVFAARRIGGKQSVPVDDNFESATFALLDGIQDDLYSAATERLESRTFRVESYETMTSALERGEDLGFFLAPWKDDAQNEQHIKEDCKATLRCYPSDLQHECTGKKCFYSGKPATHMAIFARAY